MTVTADTNNRPILPFILVVISALVLRLVWIDVSEFQHDEAYLSLLALDALDMRQFPLLGMPSSVGIPNAPASLWLTIIPYALGGDALVATAFVALLNAGGVVLLYLLARRWFGWQGAFAAGMIYAVSPWAVIYSRKIWAQNMHTPFILLALLLGDIGFREGRRWAQVLALPVLVFGLQMHYAAWTLLPIVMWWLWTGRKRLSRGALIASIILAVLVMLPFGVGLVQSESVTVTGLMDRFVSSDETDSTLQINTASLQVHQYFLTMDRLDIYFAPGQLTELYGRLNVMRWVWIGFFGGSALLGLMALRKRPDMLALFGLWLIVPIIVFTLDWTSVFPHYFIPSLPALYLLVGMGVGLLWERLPRLRWVTAPVFGTVILSLVVLWYSVLIYGDSVHVERGFGRTFADLSPVSQAVAARENVLLVTDRYRDFNHPQPTTWATLLHGKVECLRVVDGGAFTVIPPDRQSSQILSTHQSSRSAKNTAIQWEWCSQCGTVAGATVSIRLTRSFASRT
jgi:4-amino-4-deoxy-L-arabinose transferase-like glycosyltransferase